MLLLPHIKVPIIALLWLVQISLSQRQIDPEIQKQIDDFITNQYLPASNTSSLGLAIVGNDGEIFYTTGYGLANVEKMIPVGNDTQFSLGSVTKSVTSLVVAEVLHEMFPELDESVLDTPIRNLVPEANFTLNDRFRSEHGTFRDLLAHRMCLFVDVISPFAEAFNSTDEIVYRQRYTEETCGMRSEMRYNNQMYVMAGELIGMIAGRPYEELVENLLRRIGMNDSAFVKLTDDTPQMPNRAQPYYNIYNISYPMNTDLLKRVIPVKAAGGLFTTPNDMSKLLRLYLNNGVIDGNQIVPRKVMEWLEKPASFPNLLQFKSSDDQPVLTGYGYGLGLVTGAYDGWKMLQHSGYFSSYSSLMAMFPAKKLGIFTTTNQAPVLVNQMVIHTFIFDLLRGAEKGKENAVRFMEQSRVAKIQNMNAQLDSRKEIIAIYKAKGHKKNVDEIIGKYGSGSLGDVEISEKFNEATNSTGIYLDYGKWAKGWMDSIGGDLYEITWDTDVVQENYAFGNYDGRNLAIVENETLSIILQFEGVLTTTAKFKLGVSLDKLPPIPWAPDSCGPEKK